VNIIPPPISTTIKYIVGIWRKLQSKRKEKRKGKLTNNLTTKNLGNYHRGVDVVKKRSFAGLSNK
jgi:hypothetical protein